MKDHLEAKLSEVNALVNDLGNLPEKVARRPSTRRRRSIQVDDSLTKAIEERELRHRQTLLEQEGRLPAILEDKYFPRRTFETADIQALANDVQDDPLESPDLGPPPVAHFDEQDVLDFNFMKASRRTSTELVEESEKPGRTMMTDSETRRKRRISILLEPSNFGSAAEKVEVTDYEEPDSTEVRVDEPQKKELPIAPQPLRVGAKRKLEMSELEDTSRISKELDDFTFRRKAIVAAPTPKSSRFSRPLSRQNQENAEVTAPGSPDRSAQPNRRVLAQKSTNSPAKRKVGATFEKPPIDKEDVTETRPERRQVARIRIKQSTTIPPLVATGNEDMEVKDQMREAGQSRMPPKTPATEADDIISPFSDEPSTTKQRPPQEMAVTNSVEDVLNGSIGRGSRRARAAVSYAEPNLRDKMRRPGKALVSAVEGLAKQPIDVDKTYIRAASAGADSGSETVRQERRSISDVRIKEDPDFAEQRKARRWQELERAQEGRSEPASPLRGKDDSNSQAGQPVVLTQNNELSKAVAKLSFLDGPTSSPVTAEEQDDSAQPVQIVGRFKRHSVQPTTEKINDHAPESRPSVVKSREPNSALGVRQSESRDGAEMRNAMRRSASVATLAGASKSNVRNGVASGDHTRAEHASSELHDQVDQNIRGSILTRRKSMMV